MEKVMHPEIARAIAATQIDDWLAQADAGRLARRARRNGSDHGAGRALWRSLRSRGGAGHAALRRA